MEINPVRSLNQGGHEGTLECSIEECGTGRGESWYTWLQAGTMHFSAPMRSLSCVAQQQVQFSKNHNKFSTEKISEIKSSLSF